MGWRHARRRRGGIQRHDAARLERPSHGEALRTQERFHRRDFGHIDLAVTIDDPKMYMKAFTINVTKVLLPDTDILESVCKNEKDLQHLDTDK